MTGVSYLQVLRTGRLAGVIAGDAVGKLGDGMLFVALPLLALQMHGSLRPAAARRAPWPLPCCSTRAPR